MRSLHLAISKRSLLFCSLVLFDEILLVPVNTEAGTIPLKRSLTSLPLRVPFPIPQGLYVVLGVWTLCVLLFEVLASGEPA